MRKIQTQDVFKLARILKIADISDSVAEFVTEGKKKGTDEEALGVKVILSIVSSVSDTKAENLIYDLVGGIAEKNPEDVKTQSLDDTISDIKQIAAENDLKAFFNMASRLTIS